MTTVLNTDKVPDAADDLVRVLYGIFATTSELGLQPTEFPVPCLVDIAVKRFNKQIKPHTVIAAA